ncbi:MAG TPA: mechanosensitive ion channel family protein [Candidatus Dojkabacteria bacterium]|jgi:small-conductance mechanosensitive channel
MSQVTIREFLEKEFWGNKAEEYLYALTAFIVALILIKFIQILLVTILKRFIKKTVFDFDDLIYKLIHNISWPLIIIFSLNISFRFLDISDRVLNYFWIATLVILAIFIVRIIQEFIGFFARHIRKKIEAEDKAADSAVINTFKNIANFIVWIIAVLVILDNLGYDISALIAGVGVGGIAIAFALQNVLEDIFASISIYFDKPFKVGDFIKVGEDLGTVKKIGIKSSRIKTLEGEELVIPNTNLAQMRVRNYKKLSTRRIQFQIGVTYETPSVQLKKIPSIIEKITKSIDVIELDRVHFKSFGDFSLIFEIVYFVNESSYNIYMDVQQKMNLEIMEAFQKEKIDFAYPTQNIILSK